MANVSEHHVGSNSTTKTNIYWAQAFFSGVGAWFLWPDKLVDYGWGLLSIFLWASCLVAIKLALIEMFTAYQRDKQIKKFLGKGEQPKSSGLATYEDMNKAGMR